MDYTDIPFADCQRGTEGEMLLFALDRVHRQFAWKSGGLTAEQLRQTHPPSKLTIAWTIKHLTFVEAHWTASAHGYDLDPSWENGVDAVEMEPEELYQLWYDTIAGCRRTWAETVERDELDALHPEGGDDYIVNRRRSLVDILEENLLHTGQTSIVRESIDGLTGNDPP